MDPYWLTMPEDQRGSGLPPWFRFQPTDVELLEHYLIPKIKNREPASKFIVELDVFHFDPDNLPFSEFKNAVKNEGYFFTKVKPKKFLDEDTTRTTPSGYWKAYEVNTVIYGSDGGIIGFKDTYSFYKGKDPSGEKTDSVMIEYRCNPIRVQGCSVTSGESYIACKVMHENKNETSQTVTERNAAS